MSLAFITDGNLPPPTPVIIFSLGIFYFGYRSRFHVLDEESGLLRKYSIWGISLRTEKINKSEIQGVVVYNYKQEDTQFVTNDYTNEREVRGLGTQSTYYSMYIRISGKHYAIKLGSSDSNLTQIGKQLAQRVEVRFYPPSVSPPWQKKKKS